MQLVLSLLISSFGLGYFIYGKKTVRYSFLFAGLLLMFYSYFVPGLLLMVFIGLLLLVVPFFIHV